MPDLWWRCEFTFQKVKEHLVHKVLTTAVANRATISIAKEKQHGS